MKRRLFFALSLAGLVHFSLFAQTPEIPEVIKLAKTPEEKGLAIAVETDRRDTGWVDFTADMTMILKNRNGDEAYRELRTKVLEVLGDGDKSMNFFDKPLDLKGTVSLTFSHGLRSDEQWIYLPALKRVKRISSENKSGPFMGSEYAYEDLSYWEVKKYTYRHVRDDVADGHECFLVENMPAYKYSGYTRQVEWLDKIMYQPRRIDYYDRKNVWLKTMTLSKYQQYLGRYWRPGHVIMENHQTGKSTILWLKNYRFRTGLTSRDFTKNAIKRMRGSRKQ
ncbi:MAG: outer membrane lipoprotein-sorting protein [Gammaproteobacteria bacterium]|nr:outer membrane lipoprotein-sorting protein [Gammaproteobacteria bacterium]